MSTVVIEERFCWLCYRRNGVPVGCEDDVKCACGAAYQRSGWLWTEMADFQKRDAIRSLRG